jgi:hypothetical protein
MGMHFAGEPGGDQLLLAMGAQRAVYSYSSVASVIMVRAGDHRQGEGQRGGHSGLWAKVRAIAVFVAVSCIMRCTMA